SPSEPRGAARAAETAGRPGDRRGSPRVPVTLPVRVRDYHGHEWETTSVNFSPTSMKVRASGSPQPGPAVELSFTPPGDEPVQVVSVPIRINLDGYVFYFTNLTEAQLDRLTRLIRRLTVLSPPS